MIIRNGNVFQEDGTYRRMDLYVENGRIVDCGTEVSEKEEIDAAGLKVLPGLVDIHSHGLWAMIFLMRMPPDLKKFFNMRNPRELHPTALHQ